nr:MAG TPA: hypothetical protein [Caudoviricetes sp.]
MRTKLTFKARQRKSPDPVNESGQCNTSKITNTPQ